MGSPNFDRFAVVTLNGDDTKFGVLLTAIVNFLLVADAIYFVVAVPMNPDMKEVAAADPQIVLLTIIRDSLQQERRN
ncbi:Large-conductance mechanosensitive channel [Arthrobacter sp. SO5]|nr:Large-conductance mechanosensitive channel [Arthrobacter sp. SO5]